MKNVCIASPRHTTLKRDGAGRLHCTTGPAVAYPDGWSIYAVHGVRVPENVVMHPETITIESISACTNAEVRRIMIERIGWPRFLRETNAKQTHRRFNERDHQFVLARRLGQCV